MEAVAFGQHLKQLRKKKGLTLEQLGDEIRLSKSYLSHIENGRRGIPTPDLLNDLSIALGVTYKDLMVIAGYWEKDHNENAKNKWKTLGELISFSYLPTLRGNGQTFSNEAIIRYEALKDQYNMPSNFNFEYNYISDLLLDPDYCQNNEVLIGNLLDILNEIGKDLLEKNKTLEKLDLNDLFEKKRIFYKNIELSKKQYNLLINFLDALISEE